MKDEISLTPTRSLDIRVQVQLGQRVTVKFYMPRKVGIALERPEQEVYQRACG